jgi:hypothetical protein
MVSIPEVATDVTSLEMVTPLGALRQAAAMNTMNVKSPRKAKEFFKFFIVFFFSNKKENAIVRNYEKAW